MKNTSQTANNRLKIRKSFVPKLEANFVPQSAYPYENEGPACKFYYDIDRTEMYIVGVFGTIVGSMGIVFNVINLVVLFLRRSGKSTMTPSLFVLLSFCDLVFLVTFCLFGSWQILLYYYHPDQPNLAGEKFKDYVDVVCTAAVSGSIFTTVALTADRCLAVTRPFQWSTQRSNVCYYVIVVVVVFAAFLLSVPMLVDRATNIGDVDLSNCSRLVDNNVSEHHSGTNTTFLSVPEFPTKDPDAPDSKNVWADQNSDFQMTYSSNFFHNEIYLKIVMPLFQLLLPAVAIVCLTVYTLLSLRHNKVGVDTGTTSRQPSKVAKASNRITAQVIAMATVTLVANAMFALSTVVLAMEDTIYINQCSEFCVIIFSLAHVALALNSSVNLILYCIFNKTFRHEVFRIIMPWKRCKKKFDLPTSGTTTSQQQRSSRKNVSTSASRKF
ncbi:rhodopsin, GQ-coupled [Aplysia californica]|uniref:Rhodopsin, GQ-coupled n=1 Tax=Aplysia californica TaxID=6500 RepID=A0ABM0ZXV0_APLCA|nr:rhodopsin, GQ-coupled [Aplysia californica]